MSDEGLLPTETGQGEGKDEQEQGNSFVPGNHLMKVGDKEYLPAHYRIYWFNNENEQQMTILTERVAIDYDVEITKQVTVNDRNGRRKETKTARGRALYKATITDRFGRVATAHKSEDAVDFDDFEEKAETGAVARALGYLGYGTLSAEFDLQDHLVDSPLPALGKEQTLSSQETIKPVPVQSPFARPSTKR